MTTALAEVVVRLRALRVIPVVVIENADHAEPLADALAEGGLPCAEITLRTPAAPAAIARLARTHPDFLLGAGTVLTCDQLDRARDAGARFAVAPGLNARVVEHARDTGFPMIPGVCTPTEIEAAMELGVRVMKFFPAEATGGLRYLAAVAAPYARVEFLPTGGITPALLPAYLAEPAVVACGGSWMAPASWISAGRFDAVRDELSRLRRLRRESEGTITPAEEGR